jgi:hypothetical protein
MSEKISTTDFQQIMVHEFGTSQIDPSTFEARAAFLANKTGVPLMRALAFVVGEYNAQNGFTTQQAPTERTVSNDHEAQWPPANYVLETCPGEEWEPSELPSCSAEEFGSITSDTK